MIDSLARARALAEHLVSSGVLLSQRLRSAFEETPRHLFVPRYLDSDGVGGRVVVDGADPAHRARWLDAVYADDALITQVRPSGADRYPDVFTSSSTMPTIMAQMLESLDLQDGHHVLEIGTGTGYNAALLCHRLGSANVASIDIDPELVEAARERLAELGHSPLLIAGDGADVVPHTAPFDRILSTAAVDHIPPAWIDQLAPEGVIVTDLRGSLAGGLLRLTKTGDDTVEGRFLTHPVAFMPLRARLDSPLRASECWDVVFDKRNPCLGTTAVDPRQIADGREIEFFLQLHLAGRHVRGFLTSIDETELVAHGSDGSWVTVGLTAGPNGTYPVVQGGPQRIWDSVETAVTLWQRLGKPRVERFGVSAPDDSELQYVWLDDQESAYRWPLPL